jgi:hypothetical protein
MDADADARRAQAAEQLSGLYDPLSTWVNVARSRRAPGRVM